MKKCVSCLIAVLIAFLIEQGRGAAQSAQSPPAPVRPIGVVTQIQTGHFTLHTDSGSDLEIDLPDAVTVVRVPPGAKDLKSATKIAVGDISIGDRVLVRGKLADEQKSLVATSVIVMSKSELENAHEADRLAWQQRGIGGLVKAVDPAANTITLSVGGLAGTRAVTIHTTAGTVLRRYAPGSVQFDEAKTAPLADIRPGDQLRARGERSADGSEFMAEEVVSGTFRNIAGTIRSIDAAEGRLVVMDVLTGKPATVAISAKSQLRKLPAEMAMMLAARVRNASAGGAQGGASGAGPQHRPEENGGPGNAAGGAGGGPPRGGRGEFQQLVNRLPQATLADFTKGEAIILVGTGSADSGEVTAITMLGGVEPLLTAAPRGSQAFTLSPWTIGGNAGGEGDTNP